MTSWDDVEKAAPDLAGAVRARFEATGLGLLATVRKDGFPRISGIEPGFALGEMWLGMMDQSLKALDLRRDPRLALHSATVDKEVKEGDARVTARAVELEPEDPQRKTYEDHLQAQGNWVPGGPYHLFRLDVTELMILRPAGDHLLIETWREGEGVRRRKRY